MKKETPLEDYQNKKEQVLCLLGRFPAARDNDFYLQYKWLQIFGKIDLPPLKLEKIRELSGAMATVIRTRQRLQNKEHRYEPSKDVQNKRRQRAHFFKTTLSN